MSNSVMVVIDVNNLCHRNYYAFRHSNTPQPVTYGMLRDIQYLINRFSPDRMVFAFDDKDSIRKEIYPEYKMGKPINPDKEKINKGIDLLRTEILPEIGFQNLLQFPKWEADDVIATVVDGNSQHHDIWLISSDQDLYQLLSTGENVRIWNITTKSSVTASYVWERFDLKPSEWALFKAMAGCKSDNIPGINQIGPLRTTDYIRNRLSVDNVHYQKILKNYSDVRKWLALTILPHPNLESQDISILSHSIKEDVWNDHCKKSRYVLGIRK